LSLVLDASMTLAWLFVDEHEPDAEAILSRVASDGALVPSLWRLEVANAIRVAVRRGRFDQDYAERCFDRLDRLPIVVDGETDLHAWGRTRELSNEYGLTVYDAAYLELAIRRKLPLASCDTALVKAAKRTGAEVLAG
jgi:predicted nucleic acid-binding protein